MSPGRPPAFHRRTKGLTWALWLAGLFAGTLGHAQTAQSPAAVANPGGPAWSALSAPQQAALAPLKKDWQSIDAPRKQKWLEIAARLPSMPPEEQQRVQERMTEWARMSPEERGRARLQFQEARQISPQDRQARWDAYLALPEEERRALASQARTVPKASRISVRDPADGAAAASVQKNNIVAPPADNAAVKSVAPTLVQAKPGASTTLITKTATPPAHAQVGQPKIAVGKDKVDGSTLLPQARPPERPGAASAAQ